MASMDAKLMPIAVLNARRQLNLSGPALSKTVSSVKEVAKPAVTRLTASGPDKGRRIWRQSQRVKAKKGDGTY